MMQKIRIGVSACLLGTRVRYDGGQKRDHYITDTLGRYFEFVPVCPEVECGLPVPREPMHLVGVPEDPRLITIHTGIDHTEKMKKWAIDRLTQLSERGLDGFIFKSRSPSSGMQGVEVSDEKGVKTRRGSGIFARAFMDRFPLVPVIDDVMLNDPALRENYLERVFVIKRWVHLMRTEVNAKDLIEFHAAHKLLLLAHSPRHLTLLGRYVAGPNIDARGLSDLYVRTMMEGLKRIATTKKQTNVLLHVLGYFKKELTGDEKRELLEIIDNYHMGIIPLIVPITTLNHYVRKYHKEYLQRQVYLNPHPLELMARNHV
ncbi:MAG TPA: DUF523 and DUF1722 domain-containing protein [Syntrophorhabdaceae bacterium]|nr:DUF523 and DUF1722 domain-containing protein [Syntrophorhabdaceae bacterium]